MAGTSFYDDLNLSCPEIAIALEPIDRLNPDKLVKFSIPVLTPDMPSTSVLNKKVIQNKSNIVNENKDNIKIENLDMTNCISLKIPAGLLAIGCEDCNISGILKIVSPISGPVGGRLNLDLSGSVSGNITIADNTPHNVSGTLRMTPKARYIAKGSKWIIVFIAGDINKIRIIGRYD